MANISHEKDLEMLRKNPDGTYTKYNPKTKSSNVSASVNGVAGLDVQTILSNLFQFANNGKKAVANAVTARGVSASPADTFAVLADKIGLINTGKKWASGTITRTFGELKTYQVTGLDFKPTLVIINQMGSPRLVLFLYNNNHSITLTGDLNLYDDSWKWNEVTTNGFSFTSKSPNNGYKLNWFALE